MRVDLAVSSAFAVLASACNPLDPFNADFPAIEDALYFEASPQKPTPDQVTSLKVMTYNIEFAGARLKFFYECGGTRENMTEAEVSDNLTGLAGVIRQIDPDVLFLQEADVESKRAQYVNEVQWLLDHTALNYAVYASQWRADYVPSDGIGRIDSGNAILSRWPIVDAQRLALALSKDDSALTQYFYLKRNILRARIPLPNVQDLHVLNMHAEAFSNDHIRKEHIKTFGQVMAEIDAADGWVVGGGDFNTIPPGSLITKGFSDDCTTDARFANDDYSGEEHYLDDLYAAYDEAIPIAAYELNNDPYFSFTGDPTVGWNRRIDYLFTNRQFVFASGLVHQGVDQGGIDTIMVSDHAPVSASPMVQP